MLRYQRMWWVPLVAALMALLPIKPVHAYIDGLTGTSFHFTATAGRISTPDGGNLPFWGFANYSGVGGGKNQNLPQYPGPTLILTEGQQVTITLTNELAEPVSMVFPGMTMLSSTVPVFPRGVKGKLTSLAPEAPPGGSQTYAFTAGKPGTYYYQSGSNQPIQVRMGLFGAIIVRPLQDGTARVVDISAHQLQDPAAADPTVPTVALSKTFTKFAYNDGDGSTGYDREYLFLISEMDPYFQKWMEFGGAYDLSKWKANYWFINGRCGPDTMGMAVIKGMNATVTGRAILPSQPYNAMPLMHPGETVLLRIINMGGDFHPFHTHGNHARVVGVDGNFQSTTGTGADLSVQRFTITTAPGKTQDATFTWTGEKLGWEIYNHINDVDNAPLGWATNPASKGTEDFDYNNNGIYELQPLTPYEYIGDHGKHFNPFTSPQFDTDTPTLPAQGVPVILPTIEETIAGPQWSGSPYLGSKAPLPPGEGGFNPFNGLFFMWHSHAERELTNFNIFPGGLLTMLGVVPWPMPGSPDNLSAQDDFVGM